MSEEKQLDFEQNQEKKSGITLYQQPSHNIRKPYNYVVSRRIIGSYHTNGFFSAIIEGKRGIGKSSYALHVLHDIYVSMGYSDAVAWDMALSRCLFTITEIIDFLKNAQDKGEREVCFLWDDAGVFASNLLYFVKVKEVHLLQSLMDTIRSSVNGVLITAPSQFSLLKFLRRYDNNIIQIGYDEAKGHWYRVAKGYQKFTLPSGKIVIFHRFNDYYYCRLPKKIYDRYMEKRDSYNRHNIMGLEEMLKKKKKGVKHGK